jgi:uncharacterized small protein (DUF1192 family)
MSCGHGWHGCGPWYGPPRGEGWYGPYDWYEELDRPMRRRYRRQTRSDTESVAEDLEARLSALREEISRAETELAELRGRDEALAERP